MVGILSDVIPAVLMSHSWDCDPFEAQTLIYDSGPARSPEPSACQGENHHLRI